MEITQAHKKALDAKGLKKANDFRASITAENESSWPAGMAQLRKDVVAFARSFPVVGFDVANMRYKQ